MGRASTMAFSFHNSETSDEDKVSIATEILWFIKLNKLNTGTEEIPQCPEHMTKKHVRNKDFNALLTASK